MQVEFFDNPPTIGDIHQNQIFKFVEHFSKYSKATNKVSLGISLALSDEFKFELSNFSLICDNTWENTLRAEWWQYRSDAALKVYRQVVMPEMKSTRKPKPLTDVFLYRNCNMVSSKPSSICRRRRE